MSPVGRDGDVSGVSEVDSIASDCDSEGLLQLHWIVAKAKRRKKDFFIKRRFFEI